MARRKLIVVKKLRHEKSVMVSGGSWEGGKVSGGGSGAESFKSRWQRGIGGGQASSGEESR